MIIRNASQKDIGEILKLNKKWIKEKSSIGAELEKESDLRESIKHKLLFVAEENKKLIGYLLCYVNKADANWKIFSIKKNQEYIKLDALYVDKNFRKRGIGKLLMKEFLKENSNKKTFLFADNKKLERLVKFYAKFNFKPVYVAMLRK